MTPFPHVKCNDYLSAAPEDRERVEGLPIMRAMTEEGIPLVASFWRPSNEELARLILGQPVLLKVMGVTQPPIAIEVYNEK